jgi:CBS domain-containing protein
MKVADVMKSPVVSVAPDTPAVDVLHLLLETNRRALPVIDRAGSLVGLISEGNFLHRAELGTASSNRPWFDAVFGPGESAAAFAHAHGLRAEEIMTREPVSIDAEADLSEAVARMDSHHIAQLPVLSGPVVVGMLTRTELLEAIARQRRQLGIAGAQKHTGRDDILAAIRNESWATCAVVDVAVNGGEVEIWGSIVDASQRNALTALIENMPGVLRVTDHLELRSSPGF